jgi:hypothetical protein
VALGLVLFSLAQIVGTFFSISKFYNSLEPISCTVNENKVLRKYSDKIAVENYYISHVKQQKAVSHVALSLMYDRIVSGIVINHLFSEGQVNRMAGRAPCAFRQYGDSSGLIPTFGARA